VATEKERLWLWVDEVRYSFFIVVYFILLGPPEK
jgi:hypothetical protein